MRRTLGRALVFLLICWSVGFRAPDESSSRRQVQLPFELIDNRVFIPVQLNGKGPFYFILDTGAGGFTIFDHVARALQLKTEDSGEGGGVGENTVHSGQARISKAQVGPLQFDNVDVTVLPGADSGAVFGKKPVDGILGLSVFRRAVVKHDYERKTLTFTAPDEFHYSGTGIIVPFELPRQIPVVEAELDGIRGKFGVDTGARSSLLLYGPFVERNKLQQKYGAKLEGVTGWGIGGPVRSLLARAHELKIGAIVVNDLVIRLSTQKKGLTTSSEMAGLIGPDVLSQFDVTFDYPRHRIIFEKNSNYGRRDSYDRAGIWMGQDGNHFRVIDVIGGGPADQAGVRQGATILTIDGVPTEKLVLPDVRENIRRGQVGKKLTLLLESGGKQRTVVITLRDLV